MSGFFFSQGAKALPERPLHPISFTGRVSGAFWMNNSGLYRGAPGFPAHVPLKKKGRLPGGFETLLQKEKQIVLFFFEFTQR
ncbi:MAG TPA: hypothetical protein VKZ46_00325 [Pedomonas sp.]|nr:hypothetical protein [Pedomonas sp.]